ncbi:MAG: hypothetical protein L0220_11710 [Acidobacteria bacterium]|nr:hypothetical protein [Acidobacteriota bacterium]
MRNQRGFLGRALGGWQFNGILRVQNGVHFTPTMPGGRNPYEDGGFMSAFIAAQSHFRPFLGNPDAAQNRVGVTDVDACIFYARCNIDPATGKVYTTLPASTNAFRPSPTGFYLMSDLNKTDSAGNPAPVYTTVNPSDVRFIINGPGAGVRFGNPFGNLARNTEAADRIEVFDFSIFKTFKITETVNIQYRLEMFNALNHPVYGTPASISVDSSNFYNFGETSGGRRIISMGLRIRF